VRKGWGKRREAFRTEVVGMGRIGGREIREGMLRKIEEEEEEEGGGEKEKEEEKVER